METYPQAVTLQAFINRIKEHEIGIYQIIKTICYKMCGYYKDLNAKQIRSYEYLLSNKFSDKFSMSCASHMVPKQIDIMLKAIKEQKCEYFSPRDIILLKDQQEQIGLYYRMKLSGTTYLNLVHIARFCQIEQIDCFIKFTEIGIKEPYSFWHSQYYEDKTKIEKIIELKKKGYSDERCGKVVRNLTVRHSAL